MGEVKKDVECNLQLSLDDIVIVPQLSSQLLGELNDRVLRCQQYLDELSSFSDFCGGRGAYEVLYDEAFSFLTCFSDFSFSIFVSLHLLAPGAYKRLHCYISDMRKKYLAVYLQRFSQFSFLVDSDN